MSADDPLVLGLPSAASAEVPRQRAPRRTDTTKRQVSVPVEMWQRLEAVAGYFGTTPNDLLVRFAGSGMAHAEQVAKTRQVAEERWAAFTAAEDAASDEGSIPPLDELVAAAEAYGSDE